MQEYRLYCVFNCRFYNEHEWIPNKASNMNFWVETFNTNRARFLTTRIKTHYPQYLRLIISVLCVMIWNGNTLLLCIYSLLPYSTVHSSLVVIATTFWRIRVIEQYKNIWVAISLGAGICSINIITISFYFLISKKISICDIFFEFQLENAIIFYTIVKE